MVENSADNTFIVQLSANDADIGLNGDIIFWIDTTNSAAEVTADTYFSVM